MFQIFQKFCAKEEKRETLEVAEPGENDHQSHNEVAAMEHAPAVPQIVVEAPRVNGERDSIAVNTSLGGTDSEDTLVDDAAADRVKGHVRLPLESQPVSDRVRLLQESVKEHHSEDVTTEVGTETIQCHDRIQLYYSINICTCIATFPDVFCPDILQNTKVYKKQRIKVKSCAYYYLWVGGKVWE